MVLAIHHTKTFQGENMSAIPLVNIIPQGQTQAADSQALTGGQTPPSTDFGSLISQAAAGQTPVLSGTETRTAQPATAAAPGTGQGSILDEFRELFGFLNLLWGIQGEDTGLGKVSETADHSAGTVPGDTSSAGAIPDGETVQAPEQAPKAFEGFLSELQTILVMFQTLVQGFTQNNVQAEQSSSGGAKSEGDIAGMVSASAGDKNGSSASPAPEAASGFTADTSGTGGISLSPVMENPGPAPTQAGGDTLHVSQGTAPPASVQSEAAGQETPPVQVAAPDNTVQVPQSNTGPQNNGNNQFDFYAMSYISDQSGINLDAMHFSGSGSLLLDGSGNLTPGSGQNAPYNLGLLQIDAKQAVISMDNQDMGMDRQLSLLSGVMKAGDDGDGTTGELHFAKLHLSRGRNNIESYQIPPSSDIENPDMLQTGNGVNNTSAGDSDTIILDYAPPGSAGSTGTDSDQTPQNNSSNNGGQSGNLNQNGIQAGTLSVNTADNRFMETAGSLGQNVAAQAADGISQAVKLNKGKAILHLNPPELGSVKVNITVGHNNHVQATFVTDHPETRHILEANMQHLRDNLAQNGFSLGQANVDVGGNALANSGGDPQDHYLTPFGDPAMWSADNSQENTGTVAASSAPGTGPDGVHVII